MKKKTLLLGVVLALLLTACGGQGDGQPVSAPAAPPASEGGGEAPDQPSQPTQSTQSTQTFVHDDEFYTDLGQSLEVVMVPLFQRVTDLSPKEQALYFPYFVERESLYGRGSEWWDETDKVYRIPVKTIAAVLESYLGVTDFDPAAAYGTQLHQVDYAGVPLGYDPGSETYTTTALSGWDGKRIVRLMDKTLLGENRVQVTVGFFDRKVDTTPYKKKVMILTETPEDRARYTLLSVLDLQNIDGEEVAVRGLHGSIQVGLPQ